MMNKVYLSAMALLFAGSAIAQPCNLQVNANYTGSTCSGNTIQFQATASEPGASFVWGGPVGYSSTLQNPNKGPIYLYDAGNYIVTAIKGSCFAKDTVVLNVQTTPVITFFSPKYPLNKTAFCENDNIGFDAAASASSFLTYKYYDPNGNLLNGPFPLGLADSGMYTLVTETSMGCKDTAATFIAVNENPILTNISSNSPACAGSALILSASASSGVPVSYSHYHPTGFLLNSPFNLTVADSGFYKVVVTSNVGCTDTGSTHVVVNPAINTILTIGGKSIVGPFAQVTLTASVAPSGGTPVYQWFKNAVPIANATGPVFSGIVGVGLFFGDVISVQGAADTMCATTTMSAPLTIVMDLSVNDIASNNISLYPNPTNGTLTIRNDIAVGKPVNITVLNAIGQVMQQMEMVSKPEMQIELSDKLAAGIYMIRVRSEYLIFNSKFRLEN